MLMETHFLKARSLSEQDRSFLPTATQAFGRLLRPAPDTDLPLAPPGVMNQELQESLEIQWDPGKCGCDVLCCIKVDCSFAR